MSDSKWQAENTDSYRKRGEYLALAAILTMALVLRLWGINFGLPHLFARPDEQSLVSITINLFSGDLNPHFFEYPSFFIYLLFAAYNVFYFLAKIVGYFNRFSDFWLLYLRDPSIFFLIPRLISVAMSFATVFFVYRLGRRFYSVQTGLVAAFFASGTFLLGREAHFGVTDTTLTFLCLLAVYYCLALNESGRTRDFLLAAVFSGLAASTKYPGVLLIFPILAALSLRFLHEKKLKLFYSDKRFWLLAIIGITTFFAASPYILLDYKNFYQDFNFIMSVSSGSHGIMPTGYWYNLKFTLLSGLGLTLLLLTCASAVYLLIRKKPKDIIILAFTIGYFLVIGPAKRPFVRYLLPAIPFFVIIAGIGLVSLADILFRDKKELKLIFTWFAALIIMAPSLYYLISFNRIMTRKDTRVQAKEWIEKNIAAGETIAIDGLFYNNLPLTESPAQTQARFDSFIPGFFAQHVSANFTGIFPRPWYYVYVISDFYSTTLEVSAEQKSTRAEAERLYQTIRRLGVKYLVTSEYRYLPLYTDNWVRLKPALTGKVKLIKQINPFNPGSKTIPQYDQIDAFFTPYAGFDAVTFPGPRISVYQLN